MSATHTPAHDDHPTFTATTWDTLGSRVLNPHTAEELDLRYWMHLHDLAVHLHRENPDVPFERANLLVSAAVNGLPVTMRYDGGDCIRTDTVVVKSLSRYGLMHVHGWGFGTTRYANRILDVATPESGFELK